MATWQETIRNLLPGTLTEEDGWADRFTGYIGLVWDTLQQGAGEAVRASWLLEDTYPEDALELTGSERSMPRYPGESAASYQARLHGAWDAWTYAGNESAIIGQLEAFGLTDVEIITARDWDWDSLAPGGGTWEEGVGGEDNWSRFWVVIKGHPWTQDNTLEGFDATEEEIAAVRDICQRWKSAEALNPWIIIVFDEPTWASEQPDGTWYDHRNRSRSALYVDGRGQRPVILT